MSEPGQSADRASGSRHTSSDVNRTGSQFQHSPTGQSQPSGSPSGSQRRTGQSAQGHSATQRQHSTQNQYGSNSHGSHDTNRRSNGQRHSGGSVTGSTTAEQQASVSYRDLLRQNGVFFDPPSSVYFTTADSHRKPETHGKLPSASWNIQ